MPAGIAARGRILFALLLLPLLAGAWIAHRAWMNEEAERRSAFAETLLTAFRDVGESQQPDPFEADGERRPGSGGSYAMAGLLGIGGVVAALLWFRFAIERPLREAGEQLASPSRDVRGTAKALGLPAELDGMVAALQKARDEERRWREEATQLRYSADLRVEARTRRAECAQRTAQRAADTDALTGLSNRRLLERELPHLMEVCRKRGVPLTVVLFDMDDFKHVNDRYGHQAGDEVLRFLGDLLYSARPRQEGLSARLGGDEFVLVLPDVDLRRAAELTQSLCTLFERRMALFPWSTRPRLSAGLSTVAPGADLTWRDLLHQADAAMYRAKQARKRVAMMDERA